MNISNTEFDTLVSKALDSNLSTSENKLLTSALKDEPNLQRRYCNFILHESLLHWESEVIHEEEPNVIKFPFWVLLSSAAAAFVCLFSAWFLHQEYSLDVEEKQFAINTLPDQSIQFSEIFSQPVAAKNNKVVHKSLLDDSQKLIQMLSDGDSYIDGASLMLRNGFSFVSRDHQLSTSSIDGVLPLNDTQMILFREMSVDTISQRSEAIETIRVYDLKNHPSNFENIVDASVCFNQSHSDFSDSTEFSLSLLAVNDLEENNFVEVGSSSQVLNSDNDHSTWERVDTTFILPEGTDYLVVSLVAKKSGPSALNSNFQSFFADELELSFAGI